MIPYSRETLRMFCRGLNLNAPVDAMPEGDFPYLQNVRSVTEGIIEPRRGYTSMGAPTLADAALWGVRRINDKNTSSSAYVVNVGSKVMVASGAMTVYGTASTGWSGFPAMMVPWRPDNSPTSWMYVVDATKSQKFSWDGSTSTFHSIGVPPPTLPPTSVVGQPNVRVIDSGNAYIPVDTGWNVTFINNATDPTGVANTLATGTRSTVLGNRVNTTINTIVFDSGTTGWCSIQPILMNNIGIGALLNFDENVGTGAHNTNWEGNVRVEKVFRGGGPTGISGVIYDSGTTGECSLSLNGALHELEVDAMALIADGGGFRHGNIYTRILAITRGHDENVSIRISTSGTSVQAGDTVTLLASFRSYHNVAGHVATTTIVATALKTITGAGATYPGSMAVWKDALTLDLSQIDKGSSFGGTVYNPIVNENDEFHLSVYIDKPERLTNLRLSINCDKQQTGAGAATFNRNFFWIDIKPSDLTPVITNTQTPRDTFGSIIGNHLVDKPRGHLIRQEKHGLTTSVQHPAFQIPAADVGNATVAAQSRGAGVPHPGPGISRPVDVGNNQFSEIRVRVKDLHRSGSDLSAGLQNCNGYMLSATITAAVEIWMHSPWIGGGFAPDTPDIPGVTPYLYRYRGRVSSTGARSNFSPAGRTGVSPRRNQVVVTLAKHTTTEVDKLDIERFGGTVPEWRYVGTVNNPAGATTTFTDTIGDDIVSINPAEGNTHYQPWVIIGKPTSGTTSTTSGACGTTIDIAGAGGTGLFDTSWAPGTQIQINGQTYSIYRVISTTRLEIAQSVGAQTASVPWIIHSPVLQNQRLPTLWGPYENFFFACGDPVNPGRLYFSNGNDPDACKETNYLEITTPSEPLINGTMFNGRNYVFSSQRIFAITPGGPNQFQATEVPNGKGLHCRWAICVGPRIYFLGADGIYETDGGGVHNISAEKLGPLFPVEGRAPISVGSPGIGIPSLGAAEAYYQRLAYYDGKLYFDYSDASGGQWNLVYDVVEKRWWNDAYPAAHLTLSHYGEEGENVHGLLLTTYATTVSVPGEVRRMGGATDGATSISCRVKTAAFDGGDPRISKLMGDLVTDVDASAGTITATPYFNNYATAGTAASLTGTGRTPYTISMNTEARNIAMDYAWTMSSTSPSALYLWQPSWIPRAEDAPGRNTDYDDDGTPEPKWLQGVYIEVDTLAATGKTLQVQGDNGAVIATLTLGATNGRQVLEFSWNGYITHLMRLVPTATTGTLKIYNIKWKWEPDSPLVTTYETQPTTHDLQGFQHVRDGFITLRSTATVTLQISVDGVAYTYSIASTSGVQSKIYFTPQAIKGKIFQYKLTSASGFRLYQRDCEIRVGAWGRSDPYRVFNPFGAVSRTHGAEI